MIGARVAGLAVVVIGIGCGAALLAPVALRAARPLLAKAAFAGAAWTAQARSAFAARRSGGGKAESPSPGA